MEGLKSVWDRTAIYLMTRCLARGCSVRSVRVRSESFWDRLGEGAAGLAGPATPTPKLWAKTFSTL